MARLTQTAILFAGVVCILVVAANAHEAPKFHVEGQVFCEVCRANFINKLSEPMSGATVRLECKTEADDKVAFSQEGVTNDKGIYRLPVVGNHEDETCEITLVKSSRPDCNEILDEGWTKQTARVSLDHNSGLHGSTRPANPLSFTKKVALPQCTQFLKELLPDFDN